jgi:hypothetical protein
VWKLATVLKLQGVGAQWHMTRSLLKAAQSIEKLLEVVALKAA